MGRLVQKLSTKIKKVYYFTGAQSGSKLILDDNNKMTHKKGQVWGCKDGSAVKHTQKDKLKTGGERHKLAAKLPIVAQRNLKKQKGSNQLQERFSFLHTYSPQFCVERHLSSRIKVNLILQPILPRTTS